MLLTFPEFNTYSASLLILVSQGILFGILLCTRAIRYNRPADSLLGVLLLITCYHRTTYTIGFMGWYDTFRNTKINYYLIPMTLAVGPLIYLYLRAVTRSDFRWNKKDALHFVPLLAFVLYRVCILLFDSAQPGFDTQQNGILMQQWNMGSTGMVIAALETLQQAVYLVLSVYGYYLYRNGLNQYFSNTYKLELRWMRNFLIVYFLLFLYGNLQQVIDLSAQLSWIQKWWKDFIAALAVLYLGIKGYSSRIEPLKGLGFHPGPVPFDASPAKPARQAAPWAPTLETDKQHLSSHMQDQQAYLDPDLTLPQLASVLGWNRSKLSEVVNSGFQQNFNDFVNTYRIEHFKELLRAGRHRQHSFLGLALESGFNSKATFNRVFRRQTGISPSEFLTSLSNTS